VDAVVAALKGAGIADDQIETALKGLGLNRPTVQGRASDKAKAVATDTQARTKGPGVYRVARADRLYLKKTSRESGAYFLRYRINGRRPAMGLGSIADISIDEARDRASDLGKKLRQKVDLIADRNAERAAKREKAEAEARKAATPTIEAAVMTYLEANAPSWRHPYARTNWLNPIRTYALPVIGQLKVDAVQSRHILAVMTAMDEANVPVLARKVRSRLKTVFDYLAAHGLRDATLSNPADAGVISAGRPKAETATEHYRRIALDDATAVFARLMALAPGNVAVAAWAWMILTAARPGEALAARWDQIDLNKKLWLNPAPKTKKAKKTKGKAKAETAEPLPVPLSDPALAILDMAVRWRVSDLVFPGRGGAKLVYTTFVTALNKASVGVDAGAPHSWRSIFRDVVEDKCGFRRETAEAALGHSLGAVEGAYRRETGVEARRPMMAAYANWLTDESNVIAFPAPA
jgi:integrase